jgi:dimethylamine/trimethylamine dehydrogenase
LRSVEVVLSRTLTARDVLDYGANRVILATGSYWAETVVDPVTGEPVPGADASLPHVLTPEQIMLEGKRPPGGRVIVYDAEGHLVGVGLAELLAREGYTVELATPLTHVAPYLDLSLEGDRVRSQLAALGVVFSTGRTIDAIEPSAVELRTLHQGPSSCESDAVVIVSERVPRNSLFAEVLECSDQFGEAEIEGVYTIGDATAPRLLEDAIFDGHRMGREIDGPNPANPLPFRRDDVRPSRIERWTGSEVVGAPALAASAPE